MAGTSSSIVETAAAKEKAEEERKAAVALVTTTTETTERVPESHITRIKARPMRKIPPLSDEDDLFADDPKLRECLQDGIDHINYLVDMEQDCLRQHAEKGYAEIGVDFTSGVKTVFILPHQPQPQPQPQAVMMATQQGNGGGGRRKTRLVFVSGFAIVFALLVVLLALRVV